MRILFVFFLFIISSCGGLDCVQPEPMRVEALATSGKCTYILLNNKTLWKFESYMYLWGKLNDPSNWREGDTIKITFQSFNRLYALVNEAFPDKPVDAYLANPYDPDLLVAYISHIKPDGYMMGDNIIILDDGSQWYVGAYNVSWMLDWEIGDRIIVSKDAQWSSGDYLLINLDRKIGGAFGGAKQNYSANVRASAYESDKPPKL